MQGRTKKYLRFLISLSFPDCTLLFLPPHHLSTTSVLTTAAPKGLVYLFRQPWIPHCLSCHPYRLCIDWCLLLRVLSHELASSSYDFLDLDFAIVRTVYFKELMRNRKRPIFKIPVFSLTNVVLDLQKPWFFDFFCVRKGICVRIRRSKSDGA